MSLFWYPEINDKYAFEDGPDKGILLSSYIRYFLARLQSMFKYDGLPDSIPQKWLENYLLCNGYCLWIKNGDDLIVTNCGIGGSPDVYYIPTKAIVANPYVKREAQRTYTRDEDCVFMPNDTYCQGLLPMLKKYCMQLVELEVSFYTNTIMSRSSAVLSAADDNTKDSAELWLSRIKEGKLGVIGETPFTLYDHDLSINQLTGADSTLTNLIEAMQYIKACLYNDIGLQSNYNMKREAINSNESQLTEDQLHPLIDNMLAERQAALEKVNALFGTNITVSFNSAWEINEREEEAEIETIESEAENAETDINTDITDDSISGSDNTDDTGPSDNNEEDEGTPENEEEQPEVEVTITDEAIEEIANAVVEKLDEVSEDETDKEQSDNA